MKTEKAKATRNGVRPEPTGVIYVAQSEFDAMTVLARMSLRQPPARLDWWGIAKGAALGGLLGAAVVGVVAMPAVAAMVGVAVAGVLTLACMAVGGLCAEAGRRMGIVSSGQ